MHDQPDTRVIGILTASPATADLAGFIREALVLHAEGADIVDFDTRPAGAFADADAHAIASLVGGVTATGVPVCVTTTTAAIAAAAIDHGASWISDPSGGTEDPAMLEVARRSATGWIIGPWSPRHGVDGRGETTEDAYTDGLLRNLVALLRTGVRSDRIVLHASAGISASATDPWRMLNHLDRIAELGSPLLIDANDEVIASMSPDDSGDRFEDTAVGLAVLAAGARAWGIRTRAVARVTGAVDRILAPRPHV